MSATGRAAVKVVAMEVKEVVAKAVVGTAVEMKEEVVKAVAEDGSGEGDGDGVRKEKAALLVRLYAHKGSCHIFWLTK